MPLPITQGAASAKGFGFAGGSSFLYPFTTFTFQTCGASGISGPSYSSCLSTYSGTPWITDTNFFQAINGVQIWTVPASGNYQFTVTGARGGHADNGDGGGGYCARTVATLNLTGGDKLAIVVGQKGRNSAAGTYYNAGGGGGSFVYVYATGSLLLVAGGGGGISNAGSVNSLTNTWASVSTSGNPGYSDISGGSGNAGGSGGNAGGSPSYSNGSGPGGGWNTTSPFAQNACGYPVNVSGGYGYPNFTGGNGYSNCQYDLPGGFGGGGGGSGACCSSGSGGGGGYSGGGVGNSCCQSCGGGGGSYAAPNANSVTITTGIGQQDGTVVVTKI